VLRDQHDDYRPNDRAEREAHDGGFCGHAAKAADEGADDGTHCGPQQKPFHPDTVGLGGRCGEAFGHFARP
jgi:hypothetical protein